MSVKPVAVAGFLLTVVLLTGGCSSSSSEDTTTTTAAARTTVVSPAAAAETMQFDKAVQQQLYDVGCHPGAVDGKFGAQTDAAILAFQRADGLPADGEYGPETESALKKAVAEGKVVCVAASSTTTTATASSTAAPSGPACTATVITNAIGGDPGTQLYTYRCSGGFAAAGVGNPDVEGGSSTFLLKAQNGTWVVLDKEPECTKQPPVVPQDLQNIVCTT